MKEQDDHCDDYIAVPGVPRCLQWYLFINRLPAAEKYMCLENGVADPKLFAKYKGKWVRVVMASRFGDVGITEKLDRDYGYSAGRVNVKDLSDFTDERPQ